MTAKQRGELTSAPLDLQATSALVNTAVSLHQATLARRADARFLVQTLGPAALGLLGALLGALIGLLGPEAVKALAAQHPADPIHVVVDRPPQAVP